MKFDLKGNICYATVSSVVSETDGEVLKKWIATANPDATKLIIFDFASCLQIPDTAIRVFSAAISAIKKKNILLASINFKSTIKTDLTAKGIFSIFGAKSTLQEAEGLANPKATSKATLDVNFINPFIKATVNALKIQANTEAKPGKPYLKTKDYPADIAGIIALNSEAFCGSIAIAFTEVVFLNIYKNMLGEAPAEINKETEDAAGEIMNIIFGQAKIELNDNQNFKIQKAIPSVIRGKNISVNHSAPARSMVIPFESSVGTFHLEITLDG